jgi:hypothetical protein
MSLKTTAITACLCLAVVASGIVAVAWERELEPLPPVGPPDPHLPRIATPQMVLAAWLSVVQSPEDGAVCAIAAECAGRCTVGLPCCTMLLTDDRLSAVADCTDCVCVID